MMSRYQPLANFLSSKKGDQWNATFAEIEAHLGFALPNSAHRYPAWWANQSGAGHSQTKGWRDAGWRTSQLDLAGKTVCFEREHKTGASALFTRARELTGIEDADRLIDEALKALVARESALRLADLGGSMPNYNAPQRERPA